MKWFRRKRDRREHIPVGVPGIIVLPTEVADPEELERMAMEWARHVEAASTPRPGP